MKYNCDVIQDLLPLYADDICSAASKEMVEDHLAECNACKKIAVKMQDQSVEEKLAKEKNTVISEHRKNEKRKTATIGIATAGILMAPVIICLICNIVTRHALDWFFIVLTAMLLVASMIVVPMVVEKKRFMWTSISFVVSLLLLLLACCIYTHGNWFFVAGTACVFGISVVIAPFVIKDVPLGKKLGNHKAFITLLWDTVWLYLLLIAYGIYEKEGMEYWQTSMVVATYMLIVVWGWLLVLCYVKKNVWTKSGLVVMITGIWFGLCNNILNIFMPSPDGYGLENLDLKEGFHMDNIAAFNANLLFTVIVCSICVGVTFIYIGYRKEKKCTNEKEK